MEIYHVLLGEIILFEDFNKLNFVYVVNSKDNIEQEILEKNIHDK